MLPTNLSVQISNRDITLGDTFHIRELNITLQKDSQRLSQSPMQVERFGLTIRYYYMH